MAKQSRGTSRTPNRPAAPSASGSASGSKPNSTWQPSKVSTGKKSGGGLNRTALYTIGGIVVGLLIVIFVAVNQNGGSKGTGSNDPIVSPGAAWAAPATIPTDGRTLGKADAKATIDLWGDFRCSACYTYTVGGVGAQVVNQLVATGKAKIVWHDFTVIDLTRKDGTASRDAANAAICAADQNKFWVMHDYLYANQSITEDASAFTIDRLVKIAQAAGLDMTKAEPCIRNGTHTAEITAQQGSLPADVTGTPTLFVNGKGVQTTLDAITKAVDAANG
jgi:protein-disulfide isomerase